MACCAFAVFLLTQLLAPFRFMRDRLIGVPAPALNPAVAWSPGAAAALPARGSRLGWRRLAIAAVVADLGIVGLASTPVAAAWLETDRDTATSQSFAAALHNSICSALGRNTQ